MCAHSQRGENSESPQPLNPESPFLALPLWCCAEVHRYLTEVKQPSVSPQEALSMAQSPWNKAVLLDVREAQDFAEVSI